MFISVFDDYLFITKQIVELSAFDHVKFIETFVSNVTLQRIKPETSWPKAHIANLWAAEVVNL